MSLALERLQRTAPRPAVFGDSELERTCCIASECHTCSYTLGKRTWFFFFFSLSFIRVAMHRVLWKKPQAFFPSDSSQGTVSWSHKECKMSLKGAPPSPWELKMCVCAFQL